MCVKHESSRLPIFTILCTSQWALPPPTPSLSHLTHCVINPIILVLLIWQILYLKENKITYKMTPNLTTIDNNKCWRRCFHVTAPHTDMIHFGSFVTCVQYDYSYSSVKVERSDSKSQRCNTWWLMIFHWLSFINVW